jgi:IS605 OrfB family transposase
MTLITDKLGIEYGYTFYLQMLTYQNICTRIVGMQLVEQHIIDRRDARFAVIDPACFASKNLYNASLYILRQAFFAHEHVPTYAKLAHSLKDTTEFRTLPAKVAQWTVRQVCADWSNFWKAQRAYAKCPAKFTGRPSLPHYKPKANGRNLLVYTRQAISRPALEEGRICPSQLGIQVQTKQKEVQQARIVPHASHYVVEIVYSVKPRSRTANKLNPKWAASLDLGIDVLAAVTSNKKGIIPFLVNGRPLKSVNAYYNKCHADLQASLPKGQYSSHRLTALIDQRNRKVDHYLHWASRYIVDWMVSERLGILIIGHTRGWKQEVNIGRVNNQNFVAIPHSRFIHMLTYKAQLQGIRVIVQEEGYTSKCSFLDLEPICKHAEYCGQRVRRAEFVSARRLPIHADVNGSYNILRKALPTAFAHGIQGVVVRPVRVQPVRKLVHWHCL